MSQAKKFFQRQLWGQQSAPDHGTTHKAPAKPEEENQEIRREVWGGEELSGKELKGAARSLTEIMKDWGAASKCNEREKIWAWWVPGGGGWFPSFLMFPSAKAKKFWIIWVPTVGDRIHACVSALGDQREALSNLILNTWPHEGLVS